MLAYAHKYQSKHWCAQSSDDSRAMTMGINCISAKVNLRLWSVSALTYVGVKHLKNEFTELAIRRNYLLLRLI